MTIYKVDVTVRDGESEYPFYEYVNATSPQKARDEVVKLFGFNRKNGGFKFLEKDKWEEKIGYRIYEIKPNISPAQIYILGMRDAINLDELCKRPVLPLFSKDADWIWSISNQVEYWWYHGDYIVVAMYYPERLSENDSCLSITTFPYWDFKKHCDSMVENKWFLVKGDIDG